MNSIINWFEIPAADFERAVNFYEKVFEASLRREQMDGMSMAIFPYDEPATGGCVVNAEFAKPGADGALIYLNAGRDVAPILERAQANGGEVLMGKKLINEQIGHIGVFLDSEGNRIGVHAPPG